MTGFADLVVVLSELRQNQKFSVQSFVVDE